MEDQFLQDVAADVAGLEGRVECIEEQLDQNGGQPGLQKKGKVC